MKTTTRNTLNDHADQCGIDPAVAFAKFNDRLHNEQRTDAPDLTADQLEENALYLTLLSMTAEAVR